MFKALLDALAPPAAASGPSDLREDLAVAALLVHAARSDAAYAEDERAAIERALAGAYALAPAAAAALRLEAEASEAAAADIVRYTRALKESMDMAAREAFLERLWGVVLADGVRDPHEDALMRRVAALLYVPDARSNAARLRAQSAVEAQG